MQGRYKEVQSLAVEGQGCSSVPLLVLLHSLHHKGCLGDRRSSSQTELPNATPTSITSQNSTCLVATGSAPVGRLPTSAGK